MISLWTYIRTRFSLVRLIVVGFLFVMIFLDENSLLRSFEYSQKITQLEKEITHYQQVIDDSKQRLNELRSDDENLEKFGREQYLMKKPNEDIYIITE